MKAPQFTNVQFHEAYAVGGNNYAPSMTGLDRFGQVWRTFQSDSGHWQPWTLVANFTAPAAN